MDHLKLRSSSLVATWLALATLCPPAHAQVAPPSAAPASLGFAEDRFIVRLTPEASRAAFVAPSQGPTARARLGLPSLDRVLASWPGTWLEPEFRGDRPPAPGSNETDFSAFYVVHLPAGASRDQALTQFRAASAVAEAHPIGLTSVTAVPNDSLWSLAYCFYQPSRRDIHAPEAWDLTKGDTSIVVAIIDTGVVPYHPDLGGVLAGSSGQFWTNPAEAAGVPGVDDDHNGFVDDLHGWDFVNLINDVDAVPGEDWQDEDNDPNDFIGHGTCVAGLVGAISDNQIGVAGTAWNVRLMPLRVVWASPRQQTGIVDMSYVTQAIRYATRMKADVINLSLSNVPISELDLAVKAALDSGIVIVVAAGNNGTPNYIGDWYPDAVVVAATDENDEIPIWSNRNSHVDLTAPGDDLPTTIRVHAGTDSLGLRAPGYAPDVAGTSFSTPIVSGAVVLMEAVRKAHGLERLSPRQIGTVLRYTADDISAQNPGLSGYGGGRLDMARAVTAASRIRAKRLSARTVSSGVAFRTNRGDSLLALPTEDGRLGFYDALTFSPISSAPLGGVPAAPLAAADLGAGRGLGIFVSLGGQMAGFGAGGAALPGWPVSISEGGLVGMPVLGDLDGDGSLEIVSAGTSGRIWAWTAGGTLYPGFPLLLGPGKDVFAPLALSDLDGQPGVEIIAAQTDGLLHAFRWDGSELPGWPVSTNDPLPAGPVIAASSGGPIVLVAASNSIYGFAANGGLLWTTPRLAPEVPSDPGVGDLDNDGSDELVVAGTSGIEVHRLDGTKLVGWPVLWSIPGVGPPFIGGFAASDTPAVLVATGTKFQAFTGSGAIPAEFLPYPDGDPSSAIVTTGASDTVRLIQGTSSDTILYAYDFPSHSPGASSAWPTQRGCIARTGSRAYRPRTTGGDAMPPDAVSDLTATASGDSSEVLAWTAPADIGLLGRAFEYEVRAALHANDFANHLSATRTLPARLVPSSAGAHETLFVSPLLRADNWFAIRSRDASGNWSAFSPPVARSSPSPSEGPTSLALSLGPNPSRLPLSLIWQARGPGERSLRIFDLGGRLVRAIALGATQGTFIWDGRMENGALTPSGLYVVSLSVGSVRKSVHIVVLH